FALKASCCEAERLSNPAYSQVWPWAFRFWRPRMAVAIGFVLLLVLFVSAVTLIYRHAKSDKVPGLIASSADRPVDSLAVLPFLTEGGDAQAEFLGDGFAISLTNSLSQLRHLNVRPFSSVSRYKGLGTDVSTIGRELKVQAVLTGTIQKRGDELLVSVELVDVRANKQIWGERYQRRFANLFAVQEEIAREMTD